MIKKLYHSSILRIGLPLAALILAGCASSSKTAMVTPDPETIGPPPPPSPIAVFSGKGPSADYPSRGDASAERSYALYLRSNGEHAKAAHHFEAAAVSGVGASENGEWEYINLVDAAWSWFMAGEIVRTRQTYALVERIDLQAVDDPRAEILGALLTNENAHLLPLKVKRALPVKS